MIFPTVYGVPILMIVGFVVVAIQIVIQLSVKFSDENIYLKHFKFKKQSSKNILVKVNFYFNPREWGELSVRWIQVLLMIHFSLAVPLLIVMFMLQFGILK